MMAANSRSDGRRIAYLLSQYPAVSHTFFFKEIVALRERGFAIETASINRTSPPADGFSPEETVECERTFYVKSTPKASALAALLSTTFTHPAVVLRGLREAFKLSPWDIAGTIYALFYLAEAILVGRWMREKKCTHLHVHFAGPVATVAFLASVAWDIPFSLTVHGPDEFYDIETFFLAKKIARAQFVSCISHFCRSQLLRIVPPSTWDKFHVCRLGIDETVFFPEAKADSGILQLVTVGRLHPSKGQSILLRSLQELLKQGHAVHLNLIGDGVDRPHLEQFVSEHGLADHVTFSGATSHRRTRSLLASADIFVLSSFAEGVPVALMEAMAMEIVCISTYVAGIPELIHSGEDGILVSPSSVEELSNAIARLAEDQVLRRAMAEAGRKKVLEKYKLSRNIDRLAEVYRSYGLG